jgi:hypothetical protein
MVLNKYTDQAMDLSKQYPTRPYTPPKNITGLKNRKRQIVRGLVGRKNALGSGVGKKVGLKRRNGLPPFIILYIGYLNILPFHSSIAQWFIISWIISLENA